MPRQAGVATSPRLRAGGAAVGRQALAAASVSRLLRGAATAPRRASASAFGGVFGGGSGGATYGVGIYGVDTYGGTGGHIISNQPRVAVAALQ